MKCETCGGSGWMSEPPISSTSGYMTGVCKPCKGTGKHPEDKIKEYQCSDNPDEVIVRIEPEEEVLKPCPFCGKLPRWIRSYSKTRLYHECETVRISMSWGKKKDLLKQWNTRTGETNE